MTEDLLALILVIGVTIGVAVCMIIGGWFATTRVRLEHQREMIKLAEEQKLNAITIASKDLQLRQLQRASAAKDFDEISRQWPTKG